MLQLKAERRAVAAFVRFNGHPPLGVNATTIIRITAKLQNTRFQRAPTLGGECYIRTLDIKFQHNSILFQRAPTLGGECYVAVGGCAWLEGGGWFQRAPTLGGECYFTETVKVHARPFQLVSTGTHPWG